jgi:Peroxidase, family 2
LREAYHLSLPLASILSLVGAYICGNGWKLDLQDLAKHDRIEHDGSLTHADAAYGNRYAPVDVDMKLLDDMLNTSKGNILTFEDLTRHRMSRDQQLTSPLSKFHDIIARGEVAFTSHMFADENGHMKKEDLRQWFGEERLPDQWLRPSRTVGLIGLSKTSEKVACLTAQLSKKSD